MLYAIHVYTLFVHPDGVLMARIDRGNGKQMSSEHVRMRQGRFCGCWHHKVLITVILLQQKS